MRQRGFTFIELILLITVLGLLAVSAVPRFIGTTDAEEENSRDAIVSAVRAGVALYKANGMVDGDGEASYPSMLDAVSAENDCDENNPCFVNVLFSGIEDDAWRKLEARSYKHISTGTVYEYDAGDGSFKEKH